MHHFQLVVCLFNILKEYQKSDIELIAGKKSQMHTEAHKCQGADQHDDGLSCISVNHGCKTT